MHEWPQKISNNVPHKIYFHAYFIAGSRKQNLNLQSVQSSLKNNNFYRQNFDIYNFEIRHNREVEMIDIHQKSTGGCVWSVIAVINMQTTVVSTNLVKNQKTHSEDGTNY